MTPPMFLASPELLAGAPQQVLLDGIEGRHAATVRRLAVGERVDLSDGAGRVAECAVSSVGRDELTLLVRRWSSVEPPQPRLVVVQALAKGHRGELAAEMLTEVGADEIVPWAADRSVVRWQGQRGERSWQRWQAVIREATKQSRRPLLPVLAPAACTAAVVTRLAAADLALVLHEDAALPLAAVEVPDRGEVVVVVGPEGGVDDAELAAFESAGAHAVRLGPSVLRTSSAGLAAMSVLLSCTSRWQ